ncbi:MAG: hypothetical protein NT141_03800 [candidate division WWE3 bacterium]|nr:hypothetical protein [candidate division WWE3 bacterium]
MRKLLPVVILFAIVSLGLVVKAQASVLTLTDIGTVSTAGHIYNHWWYTVANPTLKGMADPSASVSVTIDSVANTATADASGLWTLSTSTLTIGDHAVVISSGTSTALSFTLTIGSSSPSGNGATPSGTPNTASPLYTAGVVLASGLALLIGFKTLKSSKVI